MSPNRLLLATSLLLSTVSPAALADGANAPKAAGAFTAAQAASGRVAVESSCGICHLKSLRGRSGEPDESPAFDELPRTFQDFIKTGYVPPLVGEEFLAKWRGKTVVQLAEKLGSAGKSFPTAGMDDRTYLEIAAYVLQMNGATAGDRELTATSTTTVGEAMGTRKMAAR